MIQETHPAKEYGIPRDLVDFINRNILPRYENFDTAHRIDHALSVIDRSLVLAHSRNLSCPMAFAIAAFHDLGLSVGREFHHIDSGKELISDKHLPKWFTTEEIIIMKEAVEDHRASNGTPPRSIYGKIVAEADRLLNPMTTLTRTVQYGLSHYPQYDKDAHYARFIEHLTEKYGPDGYIHLWLPDSPNAEGLAQLRLIISNPTQLKKYFESIYAQLNS